MSDQPDQKPTLAERFKIKCPKEINSSHTIVVADSQQDLRLIIVSHMKKLGFRNIKQLANGFEALEFIKTTEERIAVVVAAAEMPMLGGYDMLAELREKPEYDRPPFAIAIVDPSKEKIMYALENGVDEVMVKPFTLSDIFPKIQAAFRSFHNPKNPEKVYEFAKHLFRNNKLDDSAKVYTMISHETKNSARPWVGLARVHEKKGDLEKALEELNEAESRNPNFVHLYSVRGRVLARQGKLEEAVEDFKKAITLSPMNPLRYEDAAKALFELKRYEESIDILTLAVKHEVDFPTLHHYLSQAHFALKNYPKAIHHIRSAIASEPENVLYLNQIGICYKASGDKDQAMSTYNSIIKIEPDNFAALFNKAVLQNSMGQTTEAIKTLSRLLETKPDFKPAIDKLNEYKAAS